MPLQIRNESLCTTTSCVRIESAAEVFPIRALDVVRIQLRNHYMNKEYISAFLVNVETCHKMPA